MRRRLAEADAALDHRVEHHVLEMLLEFVHDLCVNLCPAVEHRHNEPFDRERWVNPALHQPDGLEQLAESLKREELRLNGNHHRIRSRKGVDGDETQGRGTVDDDVVVVVPDRGQPSLQYRLPVLHIDHLDLCSDKVDV